MKRFLNVRAVAATACSAALCFSLVGCGSSGSGLSDTSEGKAATVKGDKFELVLGEKAVTDYIADFRESSSLDTDDAWGEWMVSNSYTPEEVRQDVIDYYVDQMLLEQAAKDNNVKVEQSDIDEALDEIKSMFEDDEAWEEALAASNITEEEYVEKVIEPGVLQEKLAEVVAPDAAMTDDEFIEFINQNSASFAQGRRSSHILFDVSDEETARQVLADINSGAISFEDAAAKYSTDTASAVDGGDVGWDTINMFVDEYQEALDGLDKGEVSGLVQTDYGFHIIMCTDMFEAPDGGYTSLSQLPSDVADTVRMQVDSGDSGEAFSEWFEEYREGVTIEVTDMPKNLPYDIDLTEYQNAAAAGTTTSSAGTTSGTTSGGSSTNASSSN